ncbi:aromatic ring-hydroxylating oxygenase subunit alpha [Rhizorhabdus argentea]|uniref:aromatic ring-hydroxylating oxygenase subunit alpha n=1 Tax=Rhizorhabdus argentea TaxID=1387174 RepID=UPI0030EE9E1D
MTDFNHPELRSYYDDLMDLIGRNEPTLAPAILKVPVTDYTDRDRWEREVRFFRTTPLMLALSGELPEPGSYWAMTRVGVPMLLTRLKSGEVRLFINACRHRGAKVVEEGKGKQPRFTCIYHAWTYGLDGRLLALPENRLFGDVDKSCYGLTELAVEERAGLIWGMLTPGMALNLDEHLGPEMQNLLAKCRLDRLQTVNQIELPAANWKLALEGYLESYHFISLHAKSFGSFVYPNILSWTKYGPHTWTMTPALGIEKCDPSSTADLKRYVQLAFTFFPSTFFAFASDTAFSGAREAGAEPVERIFINQVLPGNSPETSITISRTMVSTAFIGTPIEDETRNWSALTHQTVRDEDYPVVQGSQETLLSGAQEHLTFGRNEIGIHHLHQTMRKALGDEALGEGQSSYDMA